MIIEKKNGTSHDIGFKIISSYGHGYRLTKDQEYYEVIINSAETLSERYNENVGAIRSWDFDKDRWSYPVIIDNMLNLELLLFASEISGNIKYQDIAIKHALTTLNNHFRENNSSYHLVNFDEHTGNIISKENYQGFSDESSWSRGQSWALYGFTMLYSYTKDLRFLHQAERICEFIVNNPNMPKDLIPYWDYDVPSSTTPPRDASAASIMASALYKLGAITSNEEIINYADKIIFELASQRYMSNEPNNYFFILDHSTGHFPFNSEIDVPLIFADYYFIEALLLRLDLSTF